MPNLDASGAAKVVVSLPGLNAKPVDLAQKMNIAKDVTIFVISHATRPAPTASAQLWPTRR